MSHHSPPPSEALADELLRRPNMPDREVTEDTIEEAYVRFIFYCNPALPLKADTKSLREAFRNPPKSGGRVFSPFKIYELSRLFYEKEIKTWTELTIRLGVEPPDPTRDESAQKIAQYGVRLKKWMNSMRVKAFFEYLMNIPNDYWTRVPTDINPLAQSVRDGVAIEDDMALRSLLPHIRPKRGRKRPESGEPSRSPAQRARLSPSSAVDDSRYSAGGPWSAHPDAAASTPGAPGQSLSPLPPGDVAQVPLMRWPRSAVTPTTRGSFWDDALEPRSAVTPSKQKLPTQRRGAKNVSSAWRPGGLDSGGKMRGRPPLNRQPLDEVPDQASPSWPSLREDSSGPAPSPQDSRTLAPITSASDASYEHTQPDNSPYPTPVPITPSQHPPPPTDGSRPARPSISLQVPERAGGSVRLATPPPPPPPPLLPPLHPASHPATILNGQGQGHEHQQAGPQQPAYTHDWKGSSSGATEPQKAEEASMADPEHEKGPGTVHTYHFETVEDRTNVDVVTTFFTRVLHEGEWSDTDGNPAENPSLDECTAIVNAVIDTMYTTAATPQSFLINLAALAGARMLMTTRAKCTRLGAEEDSAGYKFEWEYRFGKYKAPFNMVQSVQHCMWKRPEPGEDPDGGHSALSAQDWQKKYARLLDMLKDRDKELLQLRTGLTDVLRQSSSSR
ncbi:hypothetical protein S40288_05263 [Stachybotrys chartarum IBT 40288]|nr:hypothetical protein S40288_05263 [Stachybotrys chartarum IBT 40288]